MKTQIISGLGKYHQMIDADSGKILKYIKPASYNRQKRKESYDKEAVRVKQLKYQFLKRLEDKDLDLNIYHKTIKQNNLTIAEVSDVYSKLNEKYKNDANMMITLNERYKSIVDKIIKIQNTEIKYSEIKET